MKKRLLSAIQPSGDVHIGNYLGALGPWVKLQDDYQSLFCIADLHALTSDFEPENMRKAVIKMTAMLIACGIDPQKSHVFIQSQVCAVTELAWVLNCFIPMGRMERMTQFKEKAGRQRARANVGLFDYPALMAADILLYQAEVVPVGEDQKQHLELTRDMAERFNGRFGPTFKLPEALIPVTGARIMGLDDPAKKMAKSDAHPERAVYLLDPPDVIRSKIMKAQTDSLREIRFDPKRPGINNLLIIYELFTGKGRKEIEREFAGKDYRIFKQQLADTVIDKLTPIQAGYNRLIKDEPELGFLLDHGASVAGAVARKTLREVKMKLGLQIS